MKPIPFAAALGAALALAGLSSSPAPAQPQATAAPAAAPSCGPGAAETFICGVRNPEDLVLVPGTKWIIGSGLAVANQAGSGGLLMIDSVAHTAVRLPAPFGHARAPFKNCTAPPAAANFSAHGLNIRPAGRGKSTLYVVGHTGREAIEVFDVVNTKGAPSVTWAGCVNAPAGAFLNSVAALNDGRLVVTDFYHSPTTMQDAQAGRNTGGLWLWKPGGAFEKLAGTDMAGANGVEVSPDGKYVYAAEWGKSTVRRYELADTARASWMMQLDLRVDNLRWAPDGKLLLAGPGASGTPCPAGTRCPMVPAVVALDPAKLTLTTVKRGPAEPTMGAISAALIVGNELWLGSSSGDRVGYQPLPK